MNYAKPRHKGTIKCEKKQKYVLININTFKVRLCSSKATVASIINVHRNTLTALKDRMTHKEWIIIAVIQE